MNQLPLSRSGRSIARHLALKQAFLVFTLSPCLFARKIKIFETGTKDCWLSRQSHYLARDRSPILSTASPPPAPTRPGQAFQSRPLCTLPVLW
ncbi:hypothetical protein F5148DRAFT_1242295 [Russula earlei]|uniref:Uncharacterized protein n=1 Tax=Russula earlei TaxID=71964 RepID=A0ACC0TVL5_9AGAM|nr:hypothetical protein F5148DRAFT_1242295 [Russula earlei]